MRLVVATLLSLAVTSSRHIAASSNSSTFVVSSSLLSSSSSSSISSGSGSSQRRNISNLAEMVVDTMYPGTAVERLRNVHLRVAELARTNALNGPWDDVRRKLLWAGGLRDLPDARPGQGYTGHAFNDWNHVDLTCMLEDIADSENDGAVPGIAIGNNLGEGIRIASLPELGPGGSWSTCAMGCNVEPPKDVAHVQFRARIAFKLVWVPNDFYDTFVLVDDSGKLLAKGKPTESLPPLSERTMNYRICAGSKYAREANKLARNVAAE